jgi:hypothetical protein
LFFQPSDYLLATPACRTPQSALSDGSLDALLDSSNNLEHESPIALRRTTRQTSKTTLKRLNDNDEHSQNNPRKYPKLLTQALKDEIKVENHDHSIISPSTAIAATRPIKIEPEIFDLPRRVNPLPTPNSQSALLRKLIRTPQTPSLITKKDAPLYDLLQNLDTTTTTTNNSIDPLEQYLTPVTNNISTKDDYLAALLNSDPQKHNEISFIPPTKQQQQQQQQQRQISNDNNRITAIANDLFNSTTLTNNSNDNFLALLENKDFLDCLNDSTTIDLILSQNSTSLIEQQFPSTINNRTEKDEKAISEIYKTLVTSFNPGKKLNKQQKISTTFFLLFSIGPSQQSSILDSLPVDNSPCSNFIFLLNKNFYQSFLFYF